MQTEVNTQNGSFFHNGTKYYATLYVNGEVKDFGYIPEKKREKFLQAVADVYLQQNELDQGADCTIQLTERNVAKVGDTALDKAQSDTICQVMQKSFHLFPIQTGPVTIPGIFSKGTRQCYANALLHLLFDRWSARLDEFNWDHVEEEDQQKPVFQAVFMLKKMHEFYRDKITINQKLVTEFIGAVNDVEHNDEGGNPEDLLSKFVQMLDKEPELRQLLLPDYEALQALQSGFDKDQAILSLQANLGSVENFITSRLPPRSDRLPRIIPIHVQAGIETTVKEEIMVDGDQRYQLTSATLYDGHDLPHHMAYVREEGHWMEADDSTVSWVKNKKTLLQKLGRGGSLLQYTRVDP